ncbi:LysR family transcriptional regulator [Catenulispora subtropica]|uniref:LysR family transcriptional regulator n=1 Tax=Catenulispora subtropica TaxID=450798 RepID=A0ABN2T053_9ACTN
MAGTELTPQDLRLLLAVAETGSFTAAAEKLGLTQSAVSHAVGSAERRIGVVLFDRGRRGARPTAAGERAVVHARQILRQYEVLVTESRDAAAGTVTGTVRIAAFRSAAAYLLPPALENLAARFPGVVPKVLIVPELGRGTAGEVADGRADVGIATLAEDEEPLPGLSAVELLREQYFLVRPKGRTDVTSLPLIDWAENCSSYTRAWWTCQDWLPATRIDVADDGVVLSMVAKGIGFAVLPELTLTDPHPGVDVVPLDGEPPTRRLVLITTPATARSRAVRELVRNLREFR